MYISDEQTKNLKLRLPEYLTMTGRSLRKPFTCANPEHTDKHPSMAYSSATNKVRCFSCGCMYDLFDLIKIDCNISNFNDSKIKAAELFGTDTPVTMPSIVKNKPVLEDKAYNFTSQCEKAHTALLSNENALKHFTDRGLSMDIIEKYKLGYSNGGYNDMLSSYPELQTRADKQSLFKFIFPYLSEDDEINYFMSEITDRTQIDEYNAKYRKINNISTPIFNERYLKDPTCDLIFVTEGLFDALSIEDVGSKAMALSGTSINRFLSLVKSSGTKATFILICDADNAGQDANERLFEGLTKLGCKCLKSVPSEGKDCNEVYVKNPIGFANRIKNIVRPIVAAVFILASALMFKPVRAMAQEVKPVGNVSVQEVKAVNDAYNSIPESVRNLVEQNGYNYFLTDADLNALYKIGAPYSWDACCDDETYFIFIRNSRPLEYRQTLLHETGHAINNILGKFSETPHWKACYAAEKYQFHSSAIFNSSEWFAECVAMYYEAPVLLKMVAPASYATIDSLLAMV